MEVGVMTVGIYSKFLEKASWDLEECRDLIRSPVLVRLVKTHAAIVSREPTSARTCADAGHYRPRFYGGGG